MASFFYQGEEVSKASAHRIIRDHAMLNGCCAKEADAIFSRALADDEDGEDARDMLYSADIEIIV